jgi:hypothetical protein
LVILGIDAHKRTHTVVAVDRNGRQLASRTLGTATADHLALLRWADQFGEDRQWAVEDCGTCLATSSATCSPPVSGSPECRRS